MEVWVHALRFEPSALHRDAIPHMLSRFLQTVTSTLAIRAFSALVTHSEHDLLVCILHATPDSRYANPDVLVSQPSIVTRILPVHIISRGESISAARNANASSSLVHPVLRTCHRTTKPIALSCWLGGTEGYVCRKYKGREKGEAETRVLEGHFVFEIRSSDK